MSHILRSSNPKLHKREVTIHLHYTSFSPLHGLREDLCCGGSRRINPGLDSNTFVSEMTMSTSQPPAISPYETELLEIKILIMNDNYENVWINRWISNLDLNLDRKSTRLNS